MRQATQGGSRSEPRARLGWLLLVLLAALFGTQVASAQTGTVEVRVRLHDGEPVVGAFVSICTTDGTWYEPGECRWGVLTDSNGETSVQLTSAAFLLAVYHKGGTWHFDEEAPGQLSRSRVEATALLPSNATERSPIVVTIPAPTVDYAFSYRLQPGANLVGWVGDRISFSQIFAQAPSVDAIAVLTALGELSSGAVRFAPARIHGDSYVEHGDVLWFYSAEGSDTTASFRTAEPQEAVTLPSGTSLTAFTGSEPTALSHIAHGLGRAVSSVKVVDTRGRLSARTEAIRGDVLQIELTASRTILPYDDHPPTIIYSRALAADVVEANEQRLEEQRRHFYDRFGISARRLTIHWTEYYDADTGRSPGALGWAAPHQMSIIGPGLFAHEYFHVLQSQLDGRPGIPAWLVEGTAQYAQWTYQSDGTTNRDRYVDNHIMGLRRHPSRGAIRLDDPRGDDRYVNYGLGELAVHWLVAQAGESAVTELFRPDRDAQDGDWRASFHRAFGLTVSDFDNRFDVYLQGLEARAAALSPLVRVAGQVTGPDGRPLADLFVDMFSESRSGQKTYWPVATDEEGNFDIGLAPGSYSIQLRTNVAPLGYFRTDAPGNFTRELANRSILDANDLRSVNIQLPAFVRVTGRITGPDGEPIADLRVAVVPEPRSTETRYRPVRTDPGGRFGIEVAPGRYSIELSTPDGYHTIGCFSADAQGKFSRLRSDRTVFDAGEFGVIEIRIPAAVQVGGQVTGSDGEAISGHFLRFQGEPVDAGGSRYTIGTGADGRFRGQVEPGNYSIEVRTAGFKLLGYYQAGAPGNFTSDSESRSVLDAEELRAVEIRLPETARIEGRIASVAAAMFTDISLQACSAEAISDSCWYGRVADDGAFSFAVSAGRYVLTVFGSGLHRGYYSDISDGGFSISRSKANTIEATIGESTIVTIRLPPVRTVAGRVKLASGEIASGVDIWACPVDVMDGTCSADLNADGGFMLFVVPGEYRLWVDIGPGAPWFYHATEPGNVSSRAYTSIRVADADYSGIEMTLP